MTKTGLNALLLAIADELEVAPEFPLDELLEKEEENTVLYKFEAEEPDFVVTRDPDGAFVLSGEKIERLFAMTNFERDASINRFARQLRAMGVDEELRSRGAEDGDTVRLLDFEFEFQE
ncbi:GTPase CgtA [Listeria fleischmannii subsp. fleischmannii LU2006-1]|nr:GTPase CgtA [Listeria fleischmannii subsp. fleischmannii LU2006-1]